MSIEIPKRQVVTYTLVSVEYGLGLAPRAGTYDDQNGNVIRVEVKVNEALPKTIKRFNFI